MAELPINFTAKSMSDAKKQLNKLVDEGVYDFSHVNFVSEQVHNVTVKSDDTKEDHPETVYRFFGVAKAVEGKELDEFSDWKTKDKVLKDERYDLNKKLKYLNGHTFNALCVALLILSLICTALGLLILFGVLPVPEEQKPLFIMFDVAGILALALCIFTAIWRASKKKKLELERSEIEAHDAQLKEKEAKLDGEEPTWHAEATFKLSNEHLYNSNTSFDIKNCI